jgi:hypothetical protein
MRPDRVVVGEVRGDEVLDMLQAMNTGHDGSMTTIHSNGPRDALHRIENLVLMAGHQLHEKAIREQIASALELIVHVSRLSDGTRRILSVQELMGMEGNVVTMQEVFRFVQTGLDNAGKAEGPLRGDRHHASLRGPHSPGGRPGSQRNLRARAPLLGRESSVILWFSILIFFAVLAGSIALVTHQGGEGARLAPEAPRRHRHAREEQGQGRGGPRLALQQHRLDGQGAAQAQPRTAARAAALSGRAQHAGRRPDSSIIGPAAAWAATSSAIHAHASHHMA